METPSPFTILETPKLLLRVFDPTVPNDYALLLSIYDGPYARRTVGNPGLFTPADADARCKKFAPRPSTLPPSAHFPSHPWHLVFLRSDPSVFVGLTSLFKRPGVPYPDIGYFIDEEFIGRGYATEAGKAAVKWWTEEMGVSDIWAGIFENNLASQAVARKMGFVDGGVVKFVLTDTLTREGRAFVLPGMGRKIDGLVIDVRQK